MNLEEVDIFIAKLPLRIINRLALMSEQICALNK